MYFKQKIGKLGEDIACKYLQNLGYKIISRNYFCKFGEIDIIAKDNLEYVFIEVKTRTCNSFGSPIDSIDYKKIKHLLKSISYYIYSHHLQNYFIRIDAVEIIEFNGDFKVNHIKQII